jgi:hypothetical protein
VLCGKENVEYFSYFGTLIISDARRTREIQSRIIMEKADFNKNETLFTGILVFKLKGATSTGNMAMYSVETWTLKKLDQKYLGSFEMWCGEGWRPILVDRSCKKWRNISWSKGGQEYPMCNKMEEG